MPRLFDWLSNRPAYLLASCTAIFLALGLGQDGINLDSATYATIARNMAEFGQWFKPHYTSYCHPAFAEHPPLVMWMQGLIFLVLPPNDSTARVFGALCTLGSVLAVYGIGREIKGKNYGFLAGLMLLLTYNFMQIGNSTLLDVPMTFFVLLVLFGIVRTQLKGVTVGNALLTGLALGFAWLAKGVVSAPVWIALTLTCLIFYRRWLKEKAFWLIPITSLTIIIIHLVLDQAFAGGRFTEHYFMRQVASRFLGGGPQIDTRWWEFSYRFVKLYLPFIALFPFGVYIVLKKRINALYPILITLVLYALFYSMAAKLYYHYFCPAYALAAPLAALPLVSLLRDKHVKRIGMTFFALWLLLAVGVKVAGVRVHEIRTAEIYTLTHDMNKYLKDLPERDGLSVCPGEPNWDHIAKIAWYWRSDLGQVATVEEAVDSLETGHYSYILCEKSQIDLLTAIENASPNRLWEVTGNDRLVILALRPPNSSSPVNE